MRGGSERIVLTNPVAPANGFKVVHDGHRGHAAAMGENGASFCQPAPFGREPVSGFTGDLGSTSVQDAPVQSRDAREDEVVLRAPPQMRIDVSVATIRSRYVKRSRNGGGSPR